MLDDLQTFLIDLQRQLLTLDFLLQAGLFAVILLVALATRNLLRRQVERVEARLRAVGIVAQQFPWTVDLLVAFGAAVLPFVVWLLGSLATGALEASGRPADVLRWAIPLFGLWALYRFVGTLMDLNLKPERARVWHRQIWRPLIFLLLLLHATGLLDNLLNLRLGYAHDNWSVAVWGRNVTDETYYVRGFGTFGNDPRKEYAVEPYYQFGEPRVLGVSASYDF